MNPKIAEVVAVLEKASLCVGHLDHKLAALCDSDIREAIRLLQAIAAVGDSKPIGYRMTQNEQGIAESRASPEGMIWLGLVPRGAKVYLHPAQPSASVVDEPVYVAHKFWGAGEADCPADIKAANGELHTLRCKLCGKDNDRNPCKVQVTQASSVVDDAMVERACDAYDDTLREQYPSQRAMHAALSAALSAGGAK